MPAPRTRASVWWKLGFGLLLAAGFLYLFLRGSDLGKLATAMRSADPWLLLLGFCFAFAGFCIRALRWRRYLMPLKQVAVRSAFEILMIAYMVSTLLPGRMGDFLVRPLLMSRSERIPKVATLATVAVERLFDTFMVVLCFAGYFVFAAPRELGALDLRQARDLGLGLMGVCFVGMLFLVLFERHRARYLGLLRWIIRPLPERWQVTLLAHAESFTRGLTLFQDPRNALISIVQTVAAWGTVGLSMWLVARALSLSVGLADMGLLIGLGALGVAIPTPGGVGSYHFLMLRGLEGLGVTDREAAQAAAILMWALSFVPIVIIGLVVALRRGVRLGELESASAASAP